MDFITQLIQIYLPMYAPAIVAILGLIAGIVPILVKIKEALAEFKDDKTMRDLVRELQNKSKENAELVRCNKILIDQITKIEGYVDSKKKED